MSQRLRDSVTVTAIVAVLLLVLWAVLAVQRAREPRSPAATPEPPGATTAEGGAGASPAAVAAGPPGAPLAPGGAAAPPARAVAETASTASDDTMPAEGAWSARPPADFRPEDLAACGQGVAVSLGDYEAAVGSEFEVTVRLTAPALESCTLVLGYDRQALAVVPESVRPVGSAFRSGIEAYGAPGSGKMVIIHAGTPGKKNVDAAVSGPALTWRLRALRPGTTRLTLLAESSFTSGRGLDEAVEVSGGTVAIH
ncbi:MAG: hypothetical protein GX595_00955 [Lentisphaerae bacterium]|nr:hypothetical protein [Lentisphaerota bacterium]